MARGASPAPVFSAREASQERRLGAMKRLATGMLILMAGVFAASHIYLPLLPWLAWVEAFAEAAMVGALADWFAVTALFRHPLGLPIPHTAIIPRRKDELGENLARFVRENFLISQALEPRLASLDAAGRTGAWLAKAHNARRVSADAGAFLEWLLATMDSEALRDFLRENLHLELRQLQVTPLVGRILDLLTRSNRHQALMDLAVRVARQHLDENRVLIRIRIDEKSPWWMPGFVDQEIFDKIVTEVEALLEAIGSDPEHEARQRFNEGVQTFIESLKNDPDTIARGEEIKNELLDHPVVQQYLASLWQHVSDFILRQASEPESVLRQRFESGLMSFGEALKYDPELRAQINQWLNDAILRIVRNYQEEIASVISETVRSWDSDVTARRVELAVGRDLQFIRINGTIVGGIAGLAIYALSRMF
ncbi:MAG: DUF445 domain-containing protein [Gammaproteobacteria bacterium]|nr:DUF445 domain-containing protein [Gammaproteobacteria bacterium]